MLNGFKQANALSISFHNLASYAIVTIIVLSVVSVNAQNSTDDSVKTLEVQIYYEALCPDSKKFIRYDLYDAMIDEKLFNYTDIKFIPYGKVQVWVDPVTGEENLNCQHGFRECDLNALMACVVENNNKIEQLMVIDCLMGGFTIQNCVKRLNVNVSAALDCKSSRSIADILKKYGEQTKAIDLWFVPSVGIDGKFNQSEQTNILDNFKGVFCEKYKQKYNVSLAECA